MPRFLSAFCGVYVAIDHLKVWQTPIVEERRPRCIPVFAPHSKQRDTMINFGALPQPSAACAAAPCLQASEEPGVATRRSPKLPCDHACGVPDRILVGPSVPQIDMPAEAINRSPARTAESRTSRVCAFAIGRGWCSECGWQSALAVMAEPPTPAARCPTQGSKRARQAIGANGMRPPV